MGMGLLTSEGDFQDGQTLEVTDEMKRLTVSVVGKTLFDREIEDEAKEISAAIELRIFKAVSLRFVLRRKYIARLRFLW
jgi:cytochrome P450